MPYELEERIMFDGAAVADLEETEDATQAAEAAAAEAEEADSAEVSDSETGGEDVPDFITDPSDAPSEELSEIDAVLSDILGADTPDDAQSTRILLISSLIENTDALAEAAADNVVVIPYDAEITSLDQLLDQIQNELGDRNAVSIGIAAGPDSDITGSVKLTANETLTADSITSDTEQIAFFQGLDNILTENGTIDFLTSGLAASDNGNDLIQTIEDITGNDVNASDDTIGSSDCDWILEPGNVDAVSKYFASDFLDACDDEVSQRSELYIVDSGINKLDQIISGIPAGSEIVYLDNDSDGVVQITDALQNYSDLDAIHLVTEGNQGVINVGNSFISKESIVSMDYAESISSWGNSLSEGGDILIYGCSTAEGEIGVGFIGTLADLTGADIAASTDVTGGEAFNGNWRLEYTTGLIETTSLTIEPDIDIELAVITWDGSESTVWTLGDNWAGGVAPLAGDSIIIPDAATTNNDPDLSVNTEWADFTVQTDGILNFVAGGVIDITGSFTNNGTVNATGAVDISITADGNINLGGNITSATGAVTLDSGAAGIALTGPTTITSTSGAITFSDIIDGSQTLEIAAGTGSIVFSGAVGGTTPIGVFTLMSGNLDTTGQDISAGGITVNGGTFNSANAAGTWNISGDVAIAAGATLNATSGSFSVGGNWSNLGGSFDAGTSTVVFYDASKTSSILGNNTFYNLTCVTPDKTIIFEANSLTTVENTLTLDGAEDGYITLQSSILAKGSEFGIYINAVSDAESNAYLDYLKVYYSIAYGPVIPILVNNEYIPAELNVNWDDTHTWTGTNSGLWNDAGNWSGGLPIAGDDLVFPADIVSGQYSTTNDFAADTSFKTITISGSGYTLAGNRITISTSITDSVLSEGNTISLNIILTASRSVTVTNATETLTISGVISGAGGPNKGGAGVLLLNNVNTYTGTTTISAGSLSFTSGSMDSSSNFSFKGGILQYEAGNTQDISSRITNSTSAIYINTNGNNVTFASILNSTNTGGLTKTGTGALTLSAANTFTGNVTLINLADNTININNAQALGNAANRFYINGGTINNTSGSAITLVNYPMTWNNYFTFTGTNDLDLGTNTITLGGGGPGRGVNVVAGILTVNNVITSAVAYNFSKDGAGTLTLAGANTFLGTIYPNAGTMNINNATALGAATNTIRFNNGTLSNTSGSAITTPDYPMYMYGNSINFSGTSDLNLGNGSLGMLFGPRAITITVTANTLTLGGALNFGGNQVNKAGNGTLVFSGSNASTGITNLSAGTLVFSNGSLSSGNLTFTGGTLQYAGGNTQDISSQIKNSTSAVSIDTNGNNVTFANVVNDSNTGGLVKLGSGALTLSGANTYTGGTTLNSGTLNINNNSALGTGTLTISGGTIDNTSGSSKTISNAIAWNADFIFTGTGELIQQTGAVTMNASRQVTVSAGNLTINGIIGPASAYVLTKAGAGTLILGGANTYTGGTTISAGTLSFANASLSGSGNIVFTGGTLQYASGNTQDISSRIKNSSSVVSIDTNGNNVTFASVIDDSNIAGLTKSGSGTLTLSAVNTYTGTTTVSVGTLALGINDSFSSGTVIISSGATLDLAGYNLVSAGGTSFANNGTLKLIGSETVTIPTLNTGSTVEYSATSGTRAIKDWIYTNATVKINGTGGTYTLPGALNCAGLNIAAGTLQQAANTISVGASGITQAGGTFTGGSNNIVISGSLSLTGGAFTSTSAILSISVNLTQSGGTFNGSSGSITLNGDFNLSGGTFTSTSGTLSVGGNWTQTDGTFTHNSGTVDFTKASGTQTLSFGIDPFYNLTHSGAGILQLSPSWLYSKQITIDKSVVSNTDQANFPVLIYLATDANLAANAQADGDDIAFVDSNGNRLSHEIEKYTSATGELYAWVKITTLSASANTVIYLRYGNASCSSQQNATGVWSNSYSGAWHLNSSSWSDSTSNVNNGTGAGNVTTTTSGKISIAGSFDGAGDYIYDDSPTGLPSGNVSKTISAWFYLTAASSNRNIGGFGNNATGNNFQIGQTTTSVFIVWGWGVGRDWNPGVSTLGYLNAWHHVAVTYDGTNTALYLDGNPAAQTSAYTYNTNPVRVVIGEEIDKAGHSYVGSIDEFNIASDDRSADWIKTSYNNQNNPAGYQSVGGQTNNTLTIANNLTNSSGALDANNYNLTVSGAFSNSATLKLTGDETVSTPTLNANSTVEYSATSGTRAIKSWTYTNAIIKINGSGGTFTLPADVTCAGLDVSAGTLDTNSHNLNVTGTSSITLGAILLLDGTSSTSALTIAGTLTNSGTLTLEDDTNLLSIIGSGAVRTFTGNDIDYNTNSVTLTNIDYDPDVSLDEAGDTIVLGDANCVFDSISIGVGDVASTFNAGANAFSLSGNFTNTATGIFNSTGTVTFAGTTKQQLTSGGDNFTNITVNNTFNGVNLELQDNTTVTGTLKLTDGAGLLDTNGNTLIVNGAIQDENGNSGKDNFDADHMIITDGTNGKLQRAVGADGEYLFPIGTNNGTAEYSPATLTFAGGTYAAGSYAEVTSADAKYAENTSVTDYLNRYWTVTSNGITNFLCDGDFYYLAGDVVGTEASIYGGVYSNNIWTKFALVDAVNNTFTATVNSFSTFTGLESDLTPTPTPTDTDAQFNDSTDTGEVNFSEESNLGVYVDTNMADGAENKDFMDHSFSLNRIIHNPLILSDGVYTLSESSGNVFHKYDPANYTAKDRESALRHDYKSLYIVDGEYGINGKNPMPFHEVFDINPAKLKNLSQYFDNHVLFKNEVDLILDKLVS